MRILLIDNQTSFLKQLQEALSNHTVSTFSLNEVDINVAKNFDVIILSGGHGLDVKDHDKEFSKELDIIKNSGLPIFGICLGFQLICHAYGENLEMLSVKEKGVLDLQKVKEDKIFQDIGDIRVFECHRWCVKEVRNLIPLAVSRDGIEIVKHPKKEIYGVQFHPEMFVNKIEGYKILYNFLKLERP